MLGSEKINNNDVVGTNLKEIVRGLDKNNRAGLRLVGQNFKGMDLSDIDLSHMNLSGCNFESADLQRANLSGSDLTKATLTDADLYGADLIGCSLKRCDLRNANLRRANLSRADFSEANLVNVNFAEAVLDSTKLKAYALGYRIRQDNISDYRSAQHIYLNLKENFQSIGAYDDASWAYIRERVMERKTYFPLRALKYYGFEEDMNYVSVTTKLKFYLRYTLKWLGYSLQEMVWGYGQRPFRVIGFCVFIILVFALIYRLIGGICYTSGQCDLSVLDYFVYSFASFTTSTVSNLQSVALPVQILTSLEAVFGVSALALFTTALAQRMGGR